MYLEFNNTLVSIKIVTFTRYIVNNITIQFSMLTIVDEKSIQIQN